MQNPPDFPISNKCCEYAKKKPAKQFIKDTDADMEITGLRKSEGGIRSATFKTCYSESKYKGCNTYRPIFWYTDSDKKDYENFYGVTHSRCYSEYGLKRTGCVGCPFNLHINEELEIIRKNEPKLYAAAVNIFGKSYEYTQNGNYHWFGGEGNGKCIVEFIYDDYSLPSCVAYSGSWGYYNWCGMDLCSDIKSIKKINYGETVEY